MAQTTYKDHKDNALAQIASAGLLNNTTTPISVNVVSGTGNQLASIVNGEYVTIWDKTTYPDPAADSNMEEALITARTGDAVTLNRPNPIAHTAQVFIGELWGIRQISDIENNTSILESVNKGDIVVGLAGNTLSKLPVGTSGYALVSDSTQTTGLNYAAVVTPASLSTALTTKVSSTGTFLYYNGLKLSDGPLDNHNGFAQNFYATGITTTGSAQDFLWLSPDGQYQAIGIFGSSTTIQVSRDYGDNWTQSISFPQGYMMNGDFSEDMTYGLIGSNNLGVYLTTNSGSSWTALQSVAGRAASVSSTGQYMAYIISGYIFYSSNYGSTWTSKIIPNNYGDIKVSSSGQYIVAVNQGMFIYYSSNYGSTWTSISLSGGGDSAGSLYSVSISADGNYITAFDAYTNLGHTAVWVSSNSGGSWTLHYFYNGSSGSMGQEITMDYFGKYQAVACTDSSGTGIYVSRDYGSTWTHTANGILAISMLKLSANGRYLLALVSNGSGSPIYKSKTETNLFTSPVSTPLIKINEGTNANQGTAVLVAGTVTVSTTSVLSSSRIFLTIQTPGGTVGSVYVSTITAGTSFVITSTSSTDTSTVAWLITQSA